MSRDHQGVLGLQVGQGDSYAVRNHCRVKFYPVQNDLLDGVGNGIDKARVPTRRAETHLGVGTEGLLTGG